MFDRSHFVSRGYIPRDEDVLFTRVLLTQGDGPVPAGLISGPPGVGKTALARTIAALAGAELFYLLGHHWVTEEDLFVKLDPARVAGIAGGVTREVQDAYRPGVLLRAVLAALRGGRALVLLDEWDKCPERCDSLLLEFLQGGRIHGPFGEVWEAPPQKVTVVLTDNGLRTLAEPLLRRVYRYSMGFLPQDVERDILRKLTGAPVGAIRAVVAMATAVRQEGDSSPSLQEMKRLLEAMSLASTVRDVEALICGFLVKTDRDRSVLTERIKNPAAVLWGEWRRGLSR